MGGGAKFQKSGKFHELPRKSINCCLPPPPPPLPNRWGGVRSQNRRDGWEGGTDGREGGIVFNKIITPRNGLRYVDGIGVYGDYGLDIGLETASHRTVEHI